jgi:hypothetical protein
MRRSSFPCYNYRRLSDLTELRVLERYKRKEGFTPRVTAGELLILMVGVLVTTVGLTGDIARHITDSTSINADDFLSGWHLVLYGGVLSVGLFLGYGALRKGLRFIGAVSFGTIGFLILTFGGFADMVWHEVFGVEAEVEALVSPPHLLVFVGLMFLLAAPIMALYHQGERMLSASTSLVVVVSALSMFLVTSLFLGYVSPMSVGIRFQSFMEPEPLIGTVNDVFYQVRGMSSVVWTAVFTSALLVLLCRVFRFRTGFITALCGLMALPTLFISEDKLPVAILAVGLVFGGLSVELIQAVTRGLMSRTRLVLVGAVIGPVTWTSTFLMLKAGDMLEWPTHLWTGAVAITGIMGAVTAYVITSKVENDEGPAT